MRVLRFFERVGIAKGCKLMKMSRNSFYCYKVSKTNRSMTKLVFCTLHVEYAQKFIYAHFGMKCAKWSGMYANYHIRLYNHFEISMRNYTRTKRAARAVIWSKLAGRYYLSSYRLPIKIDCSL